MASPEGEPTVGAMLERERLYERLSRILRSISHGAELQEVLDSVTQGARELLGDEVVGIRLIDDSDPDFCIVVSASGLDEKTFEAIRRHPVEQGAGGRAIRENRLVVMDHYANAQDAIKPLASKGLQSAMAAPVHEKGKVVGSLVVASYDPERRYSESEQEILLTFAEHVSIALTDARAMEAMRQAQRAKDMFLAMVSHGLKTPLTVISGTLLTLQKHHTELSDSMREEMLRSAYSRAEELQHSIAQILEGARAEYTGTRREISLVEMVAEASLGFEQSRSLVIGEMPDGTIKLDADAARQVLGVLLENAVSHSPEGSTIAIDASVADGELLVAVSNDGALPDGFDKDTLFMPFKRGPLAKSSGVGLGLYIALELARSMGGGIDPSSDGGRVTFTLRVPL